MLNFENCEKAVFCGVGKYDTPEIRPTNVEIGKMEWIPFNYAMTEKHPENKGVHFYLDDYQFLRVWNNPDRYMEILKKFRAVCTPDFSQYTDMPVAMRIYNHYRKHWLGAYWQMNGINVIPTICWSDKESFEWCFDKEPTNAIISISSVGTQANEKTRELFNQGCREAIKRLNPKEILWYGKCPDEFEWNVVKIKPHYDSIVERRKNNGR